MFQNISYRHPKKEINHSNFIKVTFEALTSPAAYECEERFSNWKYIMADYMIKINKYVFYIIFLKFWISNFNTNLNDILRLKITFFKLYQSSLCLIFLMFEDSPYLGQRLAILQKRHMHSNLLLTNYVNFSGKYLFDLYINFVIPTYLITAKMYFCDQFASCKN